MLLVWYAHGTASAWGFVAGGVWDDGWGAGEMAEVKIELTIEPSPCSPSLVHRGEGLREGRGNLELRPQAPSDQATPQQALN